VSFFISHCTSGTFCPGF